MKKHKDMTREELLEEIENFRQAFNDEYNAKWMYKRALEEAEEKLQKIREILAEHETKEP